MKTSDLYKIPPGSTIGIMGGGQLGRMIAVAASQLGYKAVIYCESREEPAVQVCLDSIIADYEDQGYLEKFISMVDVVTFEFENIPAKAAEYLSSRILVRPSPEILFISQNRIYEKEFLNKNGIETAAWAELSKRNHPSEAIKKLGQNGVFKTARFGYDGKGQMTFYGKADLDKAWGAVDHKLAIVEELIDFKCEISVLVARSCTGQTCCFDVVENQHKNHVLDITIAPAAIDKGTAERAVKIAEKVANSLSLVGLIAVEMFVLQGGRILVNEIAPRPHNSGHWTIDACHTNQFEQMVRAVCGLPLGKTQRHSNAVMRNLIGDDVENWKQIISEPENKLHLYGKKDIRSGRKMGHVTRLVPLTSQWNRKSISAATFFIG